MPDAKLLKNPMNHIKPDPMRHIDLTQHLHTLQASLSPDERMLNTRRNTAADEMSEIAYGSFAIWLVVFVAILAIAIIRWA